MKRNMYDKNNFSSMAPNTTSHHKEYRRGITLLLVILVLASLMTISIGIFNVAFTELRIAGDLAGSYKALNAADQGMEYMTYVHLVKDAGWQVNPAFCPVPGVACTHPPDTWYLPNGVCSTGGSYTVTMQSDGIDTVTITSTGSTDCGVANVRTVKRAFSSSWHF